MNNNYNYFNFSAREFFIDEDQLKTFYIYAYEHTNSAIQLLRKIILGTNKALTLKVFVFF